MNNKFKVGLILGGFIILVLITAVVFKTSDVEIETGTGSESSIDLENVVSGEEVDGEKIFLYVVGAVQKEGIVVASVDARLFEVIELAGGATVDADLNKINLAEVVSDGQKIVVPFIESGDASNSVNDEYYSTSETSLVNINTATADELKTLPGIGDTMAANIVNYRQQNGKFKKISDIKNVSGIGDAKYNNIKDKITI